MNSVLFSTFVKHAISTTKYARLLLNVADLSMLNYVIVGYDFLVAIVCDTFYSGILKCCFLFFRDYFSFKRFITFTNVGTIPTL